MMLRGQSGGSGGGGRCLFTATQWQELEHQALIFKYMAAGSQVPNELVLPLRHRDGGFGAIDTAPFLGWGYYGQYGRRAEDPEPGRCRRTDGKKWRCSREAYGESKYCDKHMHRGKNRSRKPVEATSSSAGAGDYRPSALSISPPTPDAPTYGYQSHLRPDASSARAASVSQINPLQLHLDIATAHAAPSPPPSYHRYAQAQYYTSSILPSGYDGYGSREHDEAEARRRHNQQHNCLSLGADLSLDKPDPTAASMEKPLRRFFVDDWPRENSDGQRAPWMDQQQDETQLSISISTPPPDLAIATASRYHLQHNANE